MTAFARESESTRQGTLTLELRTVNHRYLDASFKLPEALRPLEPAFRDAASSKLARGKFECLARIQFQNGESGDLEVDEEKLATVLDAARNVQAKLGDAGPINPLQVLQFPGVARGPELSEEDLQATALQLFNKALSTLADNRKREGEKLAALIHERLEQVEAEVVRVREIIPELLQQQRDRLEARIAELQVEVEPGRLEQEIVYLAQKADVDEELDRLDAHVGEVRRTLKKGGPCGRRLDFLMQELNREANTLSSKSISASTTQNAVELKVLIEQMREQVQNIE